MKISQKSAVQLVLKSQPCDLLAGWERAGSRGQLVEFLKQVSSWLNVLYEWLYSWLCEISQDESVLVYEGHWKFSKVRCLAVLWGTFGSELTFVVLKMSECAGARRPFGPQEAEEHKKYVCVCVCVSGCICIYIVHAYRIDYLHTHICMGWLQWVGSLNL